MDFQSQTHAADERDLMGMARVMSRTKYPRILGSAALGIAYVAVGRSDAFVAHYGGLRTFDCVPSMFLLESAGGYLATPGLELESLDLSSPARIRLVAAGSRALMEELLGILGIGGSAEVRGGRAYR